MKMDLKGKYGFRETLKEEAVKRDIILSDKMLENFEKYKKMLLEWNEKINLTAITDEYEIIMKHFIDCLELVKYIDDNKKIIDVGTGAGFPGLVIAIYFEGKISITLLDALSKRINFLEDVVSKLKLKNVTVIHGRAEEYAKMQEYREKYDIVVSRAVANLPVLLEYEVPYVKVKGNCLIMKGENVDREIAISKKALNVLNCNIENKKIYKYNVNEKEYTRAILDIKKNKATDNKFPRNNGQIKKNPLQ